MLLNTQQTKWRTQLVLKFISDYYIKLHKSISLKGFT